MTQNRLGVIGIVIEKPSQAAARVNQILSEHAGLIIGRMGLPRPDRDLAIISLIIDGSTDEVGSLTGKLGNIPQVTVKSALTRQAKQIR